jgi:hypothetical protein
MCRGVYINTTSAQHPSISHKKSEAPAGAVKGFEKNSLVSNRKENTSTLGFIFEFYFGRKERVARPFNGVRQITFDVR